MSDPKNILVAVDDFQRTAPLLDYVGALAGGARGFHVDLFHAVGPMPPQLMESPGAEVPSEEERMERRQEREQDRWLDDLRHSLEPRIAAARDRLAAAGLAPEQVELRLFVLAHREDLAADIIKAARELDCGTLVVGRSEGSWFREQFGSHISDKLIERDDLGGLAICIVADPAAERS